MRHGTAIAALVAAAMSGCAGVPSPVTNLHRTAALRGRPSCNASTWLAGFWTYHKPTLTLSERLWGAVSTPLKYLSSEFGGPGAWTDTGCDAWGVGRPVRTAQHSTDDLYTIDVRLSAARVNGVAVPPNRFVRLEIRPGWPAHDSVERRLPQKDEVIEFSGPLIWDGDVRRPCFPHGHLEIHPVEPITFVGRAMR